MVKVFKWNASGDSVSPTKNLEDAKKNDESIRSRSGWLYGILIPDYVVHINTV